MEALLRQRRRTLWGALALSLMVHLLLASLRMPARDNAAIEQDDPLLLELIQPEPEPEPVPVSVPVPVPVSVPVPMPVPVPARKARRTVIASNLSESILPTPLSQAALPSEHHRPITPQIEEPAESERRASIEPTKILSPDKAARRLGVAWLAQQEQGDPEARRARKLKQNVNGMLEDAMPPRINDPPSYPELIPDDDGNLAWYLNGLIAKIRPDGSVDFKVDCRGSTGRRIKAGHRVCAQPAVGIGQCQEVPFLPALQGFTFTCDSYDKMLIRRGENPRAAYERWFLRQTSSLRDHLAEEYRRRTLATAPAAAVGHVERVWADTTQSARVRRRVIFELWDECEELLDEEHDERPEATVGARAREKILSFVRRQLPLESPLAFTDAEIRLFNASRESRQAFEPYSRTGER